MVELRCKNCGHKWNSETLGVKGALKAMGGVTGAMAAGATVLNPIYAIPLVAGSMAAAADGADNIVDADKRNCPKCGSGDSEVVTGGN